MSFLIIKPDSRAEVYDNAAEIFKSMCEKATGISMKIALEDDGKSDLFVIGSDAVNNVSMKYFLNGATPSFGIRYGSDGYCVRSFKDGERNIVVFAGGRGRSTIYAIYNYFEKYLGCSYFWDGDIIPNAEKLPNENIDINEEPRFIYRGTRYFAHRGLWRFQAEHWSLDDWKNEIDWMLKKRLNFFMLRIGMDDLWQRVFSDVVPYPPEDMPKGEETADDFNDRSTFWSLEYRGKLRRELIKYATDRDLVHPEDCGTMSHWYSPAPKEFLEKVKPDFLTQASEVYNNPSTLAWDIRIQRNMDNYMALTEGYVREYNPKAALFHTIGLGERLISHNSDENMRMKQFTYRKIHQSLKERFPNSKLLIAGWDFYFTWKNEEVREIIREFDKENTVILDYTCDSDDPDGCFLNWGYYKHFPWIFGIFHAYEAQSGIHGPYDRISERLEKAKNDDYCIGMVFWPELSHSDILMSEYFASASWNGNAEKAEDFAKKLCIKRYGSHSDIMNRAWQKALPIIKKCDWGGNTKRNKGDEDWEKYSRYLKMHQDIWTDGDAVFCGIRNELIIASYEYHLTTYDNLNADASEMLKLLADVYTSASDNAFINRDVTDLASTVIGRYMTLLMLKASVLKYHGREDEIVPVKEQFAVLYGCLTDVLSANGDYSMNQTMQKLSSVSYVNKYFDKTHKRNIANNYCRQKVYECMRALYPDELEYLFDKLISRDPIPQKSEADKFFKANFERFLDSPIENIVPSGNENIPQAMRNAATCIGSINIVIK